MGKIPYVKTHTFPSCDVCGKGIDVRRDDRDYRCDICGVRFCKFATCGIDLSDKSVNIVVPEDIEIVNAITICKNCVDKIGIRVI